MKLRVYHWFDWQSRITKIVFLNYDIERQHKSAVNLYTGECEVVPEGAPIPDKFIMTFPGEIRTFLEVFKDELSEYSIQTKQEIKNEGLLEATNKHLDDMRKLVFEKRIK